MSRHIGFRFWNLLPIVLLVGCNSPLGIFGRATSGPDPLISDDTPFKDDRLANLIECALPDSNCPAADTDGKTSSATPKPVNETIDDAINKFSKELYKTPAETERKSRQNEMRDSRNSIQGTLMAYSVNACNQYKKGLRRLASDSQFILGSTATGLGGVGALFTNGTSAIFSGLSGIASGVNGEYQRDMLSNLATSVIIPGIDRQLASDRQEIAGRRCLGISSYPLPVAIADALRFHGDCTADTGIAAAGQSLASNKTNSLGDVSSAIQAAMLVHQALYGSTTAGTSQKGSPKAGAGAGTAAGGGASTTQSDDSTTTKPGGPPAKTSNSQVGTRTTTTGSSGSNSKPLLGESVPIDECEELSAAGTTETPTGAKSTNTTKSTTTSPNKAN